MKTFNCALAGAFVFLAGTNLWAVPAGFNIQGRLTDANGINKDGTFQIKFSVFANDAGGSPVWEKNMPSVIVKNGNFQVILQGAGDNAVQLEDAVRNLEAAYVEIKVGTEPPLVPRQPLLRSPFSSPDKVAGKGDILIQSDSQNAGSGNVVVKTGNTDRLTILNNGNVGIGTNSPEKKLNVVGDVAVTGSFSAGNLVGAVMFFAGTTCPDGWLLLNGATLSKTGVNEALFNQIGYIYDTALTGGGSFKLPLMTDGSFIRSTGGNAAVLGTKQPDEFKLHNHTGGAYSGTLHRDWGNKVTIGYAGVNTGNSGGVETRPLNYAMTPCIKY